MNLRVHLVCGCVLVSLSGCIFDIFGGGTFGAVFQAFGGPSPVWELQHISYDLVPLPVPEPGTTWLLLGSGLLGVVARRRSTRLTR